MGKYNDKGQSDRSGGKYEKPHGMLEELFTWDSDKMRQNRNDNEEYTKGWRHTDDQLKGKK